MDVGADDGANEDVGSDEVEGADEGSADVEGADEGIMEGCIDGSSEGTFDTVGVIDVEGPPLVPPLPLRRTLPGVYRVDEQGCVRTLVSVLVFLVRRERVEEKGLGLLGCLCSIGGPSSEGFDS